MRGRNLLVAVVIAWVLTRALLGWATMNDDRGIYRDRAPAAHDIVLYDFWADQVGTGGRPYVDFALEYPPANLPFLVAPRTAATLAGTSYEAAFVTMAVLVDGLTLAGLVLLARRGGSWAGPGLWIVLVPLLGPVALSRLDVIPAAALVWAVVLARDRRSAAAGALIGIAAGTKVFAGLLVPVWVLLSRSWVRFLAGGAAAVAAPLLLFLDVPDRLIDDVWEYHSGRGLAVESSWGSLVLTGQHLAGTTPGIELRSGAWEIVGGDYGVLKTAATLAVIGVAAHAAVVAHRHRFDGDVRRLAALTASTVVLSVALGNVLSPQYLVWCVGAVAAATSLRVFGPLPLALLAAASAGSHLVFPLFFWDLTFDKEGWPVAVLLARNAALLAAGFLMLRTATSPTMGRPEAAAPAPSDPGPEQDEPVPVLLGDG